MISKDDTMFDVVALGEFLVDLAPLGNSSRGLVQFEANPGGAPANVVSCLSKLGKKTAFIGKVGSDMFGIMLKKALERQGICSRGLIADPGLNTTVAFVHLDEDGERSFSFYRKGCADIALHPDEIDKSLLNTRIFHFGSLSLTDDPVRSATLFALGKLADSATLISYDPNLRLELWESPKEARRRILEPMHRVDILKVSVEELEFITGTSDLASGANRLARDYEIAMVFVTMGAKGCYYRVGEHSGHVPAFDVQAVDATGAGDAFLGGILYHILEGLALAKPVCKNEIEKSIRFANAVGALVTTKLGAFWSMPGHEEIGQLMGNQVRG